MSEVNTIESLGQRLEKLEKYIDEQVTPRFDDVQDDHKSLSERINEYQKRIDKEVGELYDRLVADVRNTQETLLADFQKQLAEIREKFNARVKEEIAKVTANEIAESLSKKILVTRPAQRHEKADVVVRQATPAELR